MVLHPAHGWTPKKHVGTVLVVLYRKALKERFTGGAGGGIKLFSHALYYA
jgi:hypothetical protein